MYFHDSCKMHHVLPSAMTVNRSLPLKFTNLNRTFNGVYISMRCRIRANAIEPSRYRFIFNSRTFNFSLLTEKDTKNWKTMDVVMTSVLAFSRSTFCRCRNNRNKTTNSIALIISINFIEWLRICSFLPLGFLSMTHCSQGSSPSAIAGRLSVTRFIRRICIGNIASGKPAKTLHMMTKISTKLTDSIYFTNFLILSYMILP